MTRKCPTSGPTAALATAPTSTSSTTSLRTTIPKMTRSASSAKINHGPTQNNACRRKTLEGIIHSVYNNPPMKTLILVKRLCLRHVLIRLPCLLSTPPPHKQFQAAIIPPSVTANLPHLHSAVLSLG
ncbi:hypothetical protein N658DRAFT_542564 [Parathielavia hyrcaniae]|uniref:Uncharacterized protein n=1 Tax=Parathielavia hyrcaniae TaxID=113614 RepID=A0AAN6Q7I2_9PEZI|nr:hypothetical protein N658DRAFT_542564 [Parathielavia hyrcaniae]